MSVKSDKNFRGIPMKPYDMVREGLVVLTVMTTIIVILATAWGFPRIPPLTMQEVATKAPIPFAQRTLSYFSGQSGLQTYGPPYTADNANAQQVWGICPACWTGVTHPLNAQQDLVMQPLAQAALINPALAPVLAQYTSASADQQAAWNKAYSDALDKATLKDGNIILPAGTYGPVPQLMDAMQTLARAGVLEGMLSQNTDPAYAPYNTDYTRAFLYMGGDIFDTVSNHFNEQGGEWGMSHMAGPYPGAWWLWPYTFLYQIPAIGNADAADLIAGMIMAVFALLLIFLPFIPILNRLPYWIPVYRVIWRDWYDKYPSGDPTRKPDR